MEKLNVTSRLIEEIYFSEAEQMLKVCLAGGKQRIFHDVPETIVRGMLTASSPGQYYLNHIRGRFKREVL